MMTISTAHLRALYLLSGTAIALLATVPAWAAPAGPETIVPADPVNAPEPGQERDRV